ICFSVKKSENADFENRSLLQCFERNLAIQGYCVDNFRDIDTALEIFCQGYVGLSLFDSKNFSKSKSTGSIIFDEFDGIVKGMNSLRLTVCCECPSRFYLCLQRQLRTSKLRIDVDNGGGDDLTLLQKCTW